MSLWRWVLRPVCYWRGQHVWFHATAHADGSVSVESFIPYRCYRCGTRKGGPA